MKVAHICPASMLEALATRSNIHLLLPHWYRENATYATFYKRIVAEKGQHIILDNGAWEYKESFDIETLFPLIDDLKPHEVVLPDVLVGDDCHTRTIELSAAAYKQLNARYKILESPTQVNKLGYMVVPQGNTFVDWLWCLNEFGNVLDWQDVTCIGVPRRMSDQNIASSVECVRAILEQFRGKWREEPVYLHECDSAQDAMMNNPSKYKSPIKVGHRRLPDIHLLGSPTNYFEAHDVEQAYPGQVRSTDTAKAVNYAYQHQRIDAVLGFNPEGLPKRPENFIDLELDDKQQLLAKYNAAVLDGMYTQSK